MNLGFERNFLIRLAPIWFACRWRRQGGKLVGKHWPRGDWTYDLMGERDYGAEMRLICRDSAPFPCEK